MRNDIVILGAGKIARGFLAHLLTLSDLPFVFVEKDPSLVEALNSRGRYMIHVMGHPEKDLQITGAKAIAAGEHDRAVSAVSRAPLIFTAVGGQHLAEVAGLLGEGLAVKFRSSDEGMVNVITCENWIDPAKGLSRAVAAHLPAELKPLLRRKAGFTEAVVLRSAVEPSAAVRETDPLAVAVQDWWDLPVDGANLVGQPPPIRGMRVVTDFRGLLTRKVYTYNAGKGTVAYLGHLRGHRAIGQAVRDPAIVPILLGVYEETSGALSKKFGVTYEEQYEFSMTAYRKLQDPAIEDFIERNARDPMRKLGPSDRLVGPALLALEYGIAPDHLATAIAAAIHYDNPSDPSSRELRVRRERDGIDGVLTTVSKIDASGPLGLLVKQKVRELAREGWIRG